MKRDTNLICIGLYYKLTDAQKCLPYSTSHSFFYMDVTETGSIVPQNILKKKIQK